MKDLVEVTGNLVRKTVNIKRKKKNHKLVQIGQRKIPAGIFKEKCKHLTCILSGTPVLSMRLATFTVLPQMSYWGLRAPITPATTGPMLRPTEAYIKSKKY